MVDDSVMADLKPCPFCSSKARLDPPSAGSPGWQVHCTRCHAVATNVFQTEAEAVEAFGIGERDPTSVNQRT
jgi:hypothetical protein